MGEPSSEELGGLVRALDRLSLAIERSSERREEWELVGTPPGHSEQRRPQPSAESRRAAIAFGDYDAFAQLLPPVPSYLFRLGQRLVEGQYTSEYRIKRAFESGFWASLVVEGRLAKPRASLPLNIRPCVYIILKAPGLAHPTRVSSSSDLHRITGKLSEGILCHGFPSLAEAEAYCCGAGIDLPCQHQWS